MVSILALVGGATLASAFLGGVLVASVVTIIKQTKEIDDLQKEETP